MHAMNVFKDVACFLAVKIFGIFFISFIYSLYILVTS